MVAQKAPQAGFARSEATKQSPSTRQLTWRGLLSPFEFPFGLLEWISGVRRKKEFIKKEGIVSWFLALSLLFAGAGVVWAAPEGRLRILYLNDFHGYAEPHRPAGGSEALGGIAYLAAEVDRLRVGQPTLLLAAGDMIQGNQWANFSQGASVLRVMNAMRFDALAAGNHEFDFGQEVLKQRIGEAAFPVLGANVEGLPEIRPYVLKEIGGWKVLIIGVVTEDTPVMTHPRNVTGLAFLPPASTIQRILNSYAPKADLVIVLSHLGLPADRKLARQVRGIHLIVGGHTHTRIDQPMKANDTWIVQAWEHGKVLGCLDLMIAEGGNRLSEGRLIDIKPGGAADQEVSALVDETSRRVNAQLEEVIGEALVDLKGQGARRRETNLGDLLADILRTETGADLAVLNGGGIRTDIPQGPIQVKTVLDVLPFDNFPVVLRLSGREIREVLEQGVSDLGGHGGKFLQVSGLRLAYRLSAPPGKRIQEIRINDQPLDSDKQYLLATNDFLAAGGDGFSVFKKAFPDQASGPDWTPEPGSGKVVLYDRGRTVQELVIAYVKRQKKVTAATDGRIQNRE
jgi:5'-nucleotidase / UDP-sugar diphosphatase